MSLQMGALVRQMIGVDKPITNIGKHFAIQHHHFTEVCCLATKMIRECQQDPLG